MDEPNPYQSPGSDSARLREKDEERGRESWICPNANRPSAPLYQSKTPGPFLRHGLANGVVGKQEIR